MKKVYLVIVGMMMASAMLFGCSSPQKQESQAEESEQSVATLYEAPETVFGKPDLKLVKSGSGKTIGTVAVFYASSEECTHENLDLWYEQYVKDTSDNWCVLKYTESPYHGVYALGDMMEVGVKFDSDNMVDDDSEAEVYFAGSESTASSEESE